jgi:hypothetical protein
VAAASADTALKRTPLHDRHVAAGAKLVPYAGWEMPVQYDGVKAEHLATRATAGVFDVSHMGEIATSGPEAEAFLQRDDVAPPPGQRGRLLDDAADPALDVPGQDDAHQRSSEIHRRVSGVALIPCTAMETRTTTATVQKMARVSPSLNAPRPMTTDA